MSEQIWNRNGPGVMMFRLKMYVSQYVVTAHSLTACFPSKSEQATLGQI